MRQKAVDAYLADTSGSRHKPIPGSNPQPQDRISFITHENLVSGLLLDGLSTATDRFANYLAQSFRELDIDDEWKDAPDLTTFFEHQLGSPLLRTLFGEEMLSQNANFVQDLWAFDRGVMDLAKRFPRFWIPRTYQIRDKLLATVRGWHSKATGDTRVTKDNGDVEADPLWGTKMMRERYSLLLGARSQDESSVASTDLAFIWALVTILSPYLFLMRALIHYFQAPSQMLFPRPSPSRSTSSALPPFSFPSALPSPASPSLTLSKNSNPSHCSYRCMLKHFASACKSTSQEAPLTRPFASGTSAYQATVSS